MSIDSSAVNSSLEEKQKLNNTFSDLLEFEKLSEFIKKATEPSIEGDKTVLSITMEIRGTKDPVDGLVEGEEIVTNVSVHNDETGKTESLTQKYTFVAGFINKVVKLAIQEGKNLVDNTITTFQ